MEVIFTDAENNELGRIKHSEFVETLIPSFRQNTHDMFLKHIFASKPTVKNWLIEDLKIEDSSAIIFLSASDPTSSVVNFAESQNKKIEYYLKPFNVIEVDFGFYNDLWNTDGTIRRNDRAHTGLLSGEMHKRRPCIVLSVRGDCVQVLPLSTKEGLEHDPKCIPITSKSFTRLAPRYREKQSFALLEMIQTVSARRVFPPRNENFKFEHIYNIFRLTGEDKANLKKALAEQYNKDIIFKLDDMERQNESLRQEKQTIFKSRNAIMEEKTALQKELDDLKEFILKFGNDLGAGNSLEEILS